MFDIKAKAKEILAGSVFISDGGTKLFTPDGKANYAALWTRDFAYMVTQCYELFSEKDIEDGIRFIVSAARQSDGWIPDRVYKDGTPFYHAGMEDFCGLDNLDNGQFLVIIAYKYLSEIQNEKAKKLYGEWRNTLIRGIQCLPVDENSIIENVSTPLHSPYGFTDMICKTGKLSFETILLWEAYKYLSELENRFGYPDGKEFNDNCIKIEQNFAKIFSCENGMLLSYTGGSAKTDVWSSCYCIYAGFPLSDSQKQKISEYIIENYDGLVEYGQLRHLPKGEYWDKTFMEFPKEEYQNGAYWATPAAWLCETLAVCDSKLAKKTVGDLIFYFEKYGIFECVNGDYRKLDTYVVSITSAYEAYKNFC